MRPLNGRHYELDTWRTYLPVPTTLHISISKYWQRTTQPKKKRQPMNPVDIEISPIVLEVLFRLAQLLIECKTNHVLRNAVPDDPNEIIGGLLYIAAQKDAEATAKAKNLTAKALSKAKKF